MASAPKPGETCPACRERIVARCGCSSFGRMTARLLGEEVTRKAWAARGEREGKALAGERPGLVLFAVGDPEDGWQVFNLDRAVVDGAEVIVHIPPGSDAPVGQSPGLLLADEVLFSGSPEGCLAYISAYESISPRPPRGGNFTAPDTLH